MAGANRTMTPVEWAMLLTLSLFWGGSFFFIGVAVKELPPLTIVALRVSLASLILWALAPALGLVMPRRREAAIAFLGMGLLNNAIPFCLIVWGQTQLASGLASILNATTPLFTVLAAHFLTRDERLTPWRAAGALCGLFGVAVLIGPRLVEGLGGGAPAELAIIGAAISYAFASLFGRRFRRLGVSPIATATGQVTASSLMLAPIALLVDRPWTLALPGLATCAAIVALAFFFDRARLYPVFPHSGRRRSHQCRAGHVAGAGEFDPARRDRAARTARAPAFRRAGADRRRARLYRRPAPASLARRPERLTPATPFSRAAALWSPRARNRRWRSSARNRWT